MVKHTKDMLNSIFDIENMRLTNVILNIQNLTFFRGSHIDKVTLCEQKKFGKDVSGMTITTMNTSQRLSRNKG